MVFVVIAFDGMKFFIVVSETWGSSCESWNLTYGYRIMGIYMNLFPYIMTAYQFQQGILRASCMHPKNI